MSDSLICYINIITHTRAERIGRFYILVYLLRELSKGGTKLVQTVRQILHKREIRFHKLIKIGVTSSQTHLLPRIGVAIPKKTRQTLTHTQHKPIRF